MQDEQGNKGAGPNAATKAQPTKRAQQIEPVLRQAPRRRAPAPAGAPSGAARNQTGAGAQQVPQGQAKAHARSHSLQNASNAHEALYRQQIEAALREDSPDVASKGAAVQKRPTAKLLASKQRALSPAQQVAQDLHGRMHCNVLGGRLWFKDCQDANQDLPEELPMNYTSAQQYVSTFEPLLFEEAREAVRSSWVETCNMRKTFLADIVSVEETASGWVHLKIRPNGGSGGTRNVLRENNIVVLTLFRPPAQGALDWVKGGSPAGRPPSAQAGRASKRVRRDLDQPASAGAALGPNPFSPPNSGSGSDDNAQPADHQQAALQGYPPLSIQQDAAAAVRRKQQQVLVVAGIVKATPWDPNADVSISIFPRCTAHADTPGASCGQILLENLRNKPKAWHVGSATALISNEREFKALHEVQHMKVCKYILRPQLLADIGGHMRSHDTIQRMWPPEASTRPFVEFIRREYDATQQAAIEIAACHLGRDVSHGNSDNPNVLPFVLIQGPPGTGKTHTVRGILNVWHTVHYHRYLASLVNALGRENRNQGRHASVEASLSRTLPNLARKPRILVCAPSNAATDELLQRIMDHGFLDFQGNGYRPNVVRIGSEEAPVSERARVVWVDGLIKDYMDMDATTWDHRYQALRDQVQKQTFQVASTQKALQQANDQVEALKAAIQNSQDATMQKQAERAAGEVEHYSYQLANLHGQRDRALVDMTRLEEVAPLVRREPGANKRFISENLELSFVQEAEMVFTTLSSTGRRIFSRLEDAFENVLVDEAAQASEIAVLQPFMLGCKRVVMVGDPQQLPATVLSRQAQLANMERSMFERFQKAGCPVTLLSVQYRMHPLIRQFPSRHFYNGQLTDGASVVAEAQKPDVFYEHNLMKPYIFFDVSTGREARQGTGSLRNQGEADMAAALFWELRGQLVQAQQQKRAGLRGAYRVGVITPYRQQRNCLQDTFKALCGPLPKDFVQVTIETVDSFQGKQMDVIIMSCVRASEAGAQTGIGFVSDVRRMNVAITRAKRALWILGSAATLKASPVWKALIDDAEERGCVVRNASAAELFPDMTELVLMQANRSASPEHPPQPGRGLAPPQAPLFLPAASGQPPAAVAQIGQVTARADPGQPQSQRPVPVSMPAKASQQPHQHLGMPPIGQPGSANSAQQLRPQLDPWPDPQPSHRQGPSGSVVGAQSGQSSREAAAVLPGLDAARYPPEQAGGSVRPSAGADPRLNAQGKLAGSGWSQQGHQGHLTPAQLAIQQGKLAQQQEALQKQELQMQQQQRQSQSGHQQQQQSQAGQKQHQQQGQLAQQQHMPPQQLQQPARQAQGPPEALVEAQPGMPSRPGYPGHAQGGHQLPGRAHQSSHTGPHVMHDAQQLPDLAYQSQQGWANQPSQPGRDSALAVAVPFHRQQLAHDMHAPLQYADASLDQHQAQTQVRHLGREQATLGNQQLPNQYLIDPAGQSFPHGALGRAGLQHSSATPQVPQWTRNRR